MSMDISMADISMAGTGAYAGQSIRPTDSPGPNSGIKPIGTSARNNSPGSSQSAQLRTRLRLSLRDRLLPDEGLRGTKQMLFEGEPRRRLFGSFDAATVTA